MGLFGLGKAVKHFEHMGSATYRVEMINGSEARKWFNTGKANTPKKVRELIVATIKARPIDNITIYKEENGVMTRVYTGTPESFLKGNYSI